MVKNFKERPTAAELLKHPFIFSEFDYETARKDYIDFKGKVLKKLEHIPEDYDNCEFNPVDLKPYKKVRSKTIKETIKK